MVEVAVHHPVLFGEVLEGLAIRPEGIYVDGTFGRGGHARAILERLGPEGRLLAFDKDPEALAVAQAELANDERFAIVRGSFAMLEAEVDSRDWTGRVDGILLDLGVSSPQLDDARRGFSFLRDGPLDMRMDPDSGIGAADWLAQAEEGEIARVLRSYGEERHARRIARAIVRAREEEPIRTTVRLAAVVAAANPSREKGKHPATRVFQAIRIHVNRELEELDATLAQALEVLAPGGRLCVISFHSLEDRRVKRFIRSHERDTRYPDDLPVPASELQPRMRAVGRSVRAGPGEVERNPRARSAVLRVAEKLA